MAYTYKGEPVTIRVEVRRGKDLVMVMGCGASGPGIWSSPNEDCDIMTQNGPLCEVLVFPSIRGNRWREVEEEGLPTRNLESIRLKELEEELPF